jgi:hypothetical protein
LIAVKTLNGLPRFFSNLLQWGHHLETAETPYGASFSNTDAQKMLGYLN